MQHQQQKPLQLPYLLEDVILLIRAHVESDDDGIGYLLGPLLRLVKDPHQQNKVAAAAASKAGSEDDDLVDSETNIAGILQHNLSSLLVVQGKQQQQQNQNQNQKKQSKQRQQQQQQQQQNQDEQETSSNDLNSVLTASKCVFFDLLVSVYVIWFELRRAPQLLNVTDHYTSRVSHVILQAEQSAGNYALLAAQLSMIKSEIYAAKAERNEQQQQQQQKEKVSAASASTTTKKKVAGGKGKSKKNQQQDEDEDEQEEKAEEDAKNKKLQTVHDFLVSVLLALDSFTRDLDSASSEIKGIIALKKVRQQALQERQLELTTGGDENNNENNNDNSNNNNNNNSDINASNIINILGSQHQSQHHNQQQQHKNKKKGVLVPQPAATSSLLECLRQLVISASILTCRLFGINEDDVQAFLSPIGELLDLKEQKKTQMLLQQVERETLVQKNRRRVRNQNNSIVTLNFGEEGGGEQQERPENSAQGGGQKRRNDDDQNEDEDEEENNNQAPPPPPPPRPRQLQHVPKVDDSLMTMNQNQAGRNDSVLLRAGQQEPSMILQSPNVSGIQNQQQNQKQQQEQQQQQQQGTVFPLPQPSQLPTCLVRRFKFMDGATRASIVGTDLKK